MKTPICLLACASTLLAYDQPAPGLDLNPTTFDDIRLMFGVAAPITDANDGTGAGDVSTTEAMGPRGGIQWVHGRVDTIGWGLGLELAAAEHRGQLPSSAPLDGTAIARVVSLSILPKLVLRPEGMDPFGAAPGFFQFEIGPVLGGGAALVGVNNSNYSNPTAVVTWGGRMELVFTSTSGLQAGIHVGYEDFLASPKWDAAEGSVAVSGFTGGVSIGWRIR